MSIYTRTLYSKVISHQRSTRVIVGLGVLLLLIPVIVLLFEGLWADALSKGYFRMMFLPSVVILYIIGIAPAMEHSYHEVIHSIRSIILIDDEQFNRVVREASQVNPIGEAISMILGIIVGVVLSGGFLSGSAPNLLAIFWASALSLMWALLAWTIYCSVRDTRLITELHRQPMKIDLFDLQPFKPVGRQSLLLAFVFIGGILLSVVFGFGIETLYAWQTWLVYTPLGLVAVLLFFLNMRATHHVLATEKKREMGIVQERIHQIATEIRERLSNEKDISPLATEFNALVAYEKLVRGARTWPYNTAMLRVLFVTIVLPLLLRLLSEVLFS